MLAPWCFARMAHGFVIKCWKLLKQLKKPDINCILGQQYPTEFSLLMGTLNNRIISSSKF